MKLKQFGAVPSSVDLSKLNGTLTLQISSRNKITHNSMLC